MRKLASLIASGLLLIALATPTAADSGPMTSQNQSGDDQQGSIKLTFRLTIYGDVPEGDRFWIYWDYSEPHGGSSPIPIRVCGGEAALLSEPTPPKCEGNGRVYEVTRTPVNDMGGIRYSFARIPAGERDVQIFARGVVAPDGDKLVTAWFRYGESSVPSAMPATGSGGSFAALAAQGIAAAIRVGRGTVYR